MYVYFVDVNIIAIIIYNEKNGLIKILRSFRLDKIFKFNFLNVFYIEFINKNDIRYLIIKKFKFTY